MIIEIYGERIECSSVIKKADKITVLDENGGIIREDSGITTFDGYVMVEGEWTDKSNTPSQLDQIEAQVTYTAMMTDTLLEE